METSNLQFPPETWVNLEKMERKMSFEVLPEKFFFSPPHTILM